MKKIRKFVTRGILCFLLYLFLGICLSYARQPRVSQEYQDAFQPADFYSDTVSCDRACIIEDNEEALELRLRPRPGSGLSFLPLSSGRTKAERIF